MKSGEKAQKAHTILRSHLCFLCLFAAFEAVGQTRVDSQRASALILTRPQAGVAFQRTSALILTRPQPGVAFRRTSALILTRLQPGVAFQRASALILTRFQAGVAAQRASTLILTRSQAGVAFQRANALILTRLQPGVAFQRASALILTRFQAGVAAQRANSLILTRFQAGVAAQRATTLILTRLQPGVAAQQQKGKPFQRFYPRFSHANEKHRFECQTCHKFPSENWKLVRKESDAFPDVSEFPDHASCINCHRKQFFARERPAPRICLNCHVAATPRDTSRFAFPSLGEPFLKSAKGKDFASEFNVVFPHDKHPDNDCADCHQTYQPQGDSNDEFVTKPPKNLGDAFWLKKGAFKSLPLTHSNCFTCHNQESELPPSPQNCDVCHEPAITQPVDFDRKLANTIGFDDPLIMLLWRRRSAAGAFRHEAHTEVECSKCHEVAKAQKVSARSCGGAEGCHVTATTDDGGVLNYEMDQKKANAQFVCVKCHIVFGSRPVPASHPAAVPKASSQ